MKKILTKFLPLLLLISLISCNQLVVGIEKTFSYWANGATIIGIELPPNLPIDGEGFFSLPSGEDAHIYFKLNNPQKFEFLMPDDSNAPADIIVFDENVKGRNGERPEFGEGKDYSLMQKSSDTLELTYTKEFLLKNEQGKANLNPKIKLYNKKDNRRFAQNYNYKLRANTVPPKPEWVTTGKIKDGENWYYVLIFKFEGLTNSIDTENLLHGDISEVYLTEGESQKAPIQVKLTNNGFDVSDSQGNLIPADKEIKPLETTDVTGGGPTSFKPIPNANDRKWMLCIKTGVKIRQSLSYKVKVKDLRGLPSEENKGVINKAKLSVPKISYHSDMGELTSSGVYTDNVSELSTGTSTNPILISSCFRNSVILKAYHNDYPNGVTIHAEVKLSASNPAPAGHSGGTGSSQQDGNTTKILLDPIPGVDEIYEVKVKAIASGSNYTDSDEKTYYYKIKKEVRADTGSNTSSWQILKNAVASASAGDTIYIKGHIKSTNVPNNSGEIEVSEDINIKGLNGKDGDIIDANKDGPYNPSPTHRIFKIKSGGSLNLTGLTLQDGKADTGGAILAETGSVLTLNNTDIKYSEASNGGGAISTGGTLIINGGSVISGNMASNSTGIGGAINISALGTLIMKGGTIADNTAKTGGAVYNNGTFEISGSAKIVPSAGPDENALGKNDVYLPLGKVITVTGALSEDSVARISPVIPYTAGRQVVKGDSGVILSTQVSKFKVTDDTYGKKWKINDSGQLEEDNQGKTVKTWADLKTEVEKTDGAEIIIVDGTLIAGATDTEITVKRNVTIKGKDSSATLDANENCRIFKVARNKKLILENLTLQKGDATKSSSEDKNGGAIYLDKKASLEMRSGVIIKDNKAKQGGGIYIGQNAEFLMTGGTIENNIGQGDSHGKAHGGAVYVYGTFKMSGSAKIVPSAAPNENTLGKNDVYLTTGKVITVTGALTQTSVARISPVTPYTADRQVVEADSGVTLADKVSKFKVTNDPDEKKWKVNDAGKLEKDNQGKTVTSWGDLKTEVETADGAEVIIVEGTETNLTATASTDEINVNRNVTIIGKNSNITLNADEQCRIFKIDDNALLKLDNIKLTKGKVTNQGGGAIKILEGECIITNTVISNCKAKDGGAIDIDLRSGGDKAHCTLKTGTKIEFCGATFTGGGVRISGDKTKTLLTMETGSSISSCTADTNGGAVWSKATFNMTGGSIEENTAGKSDANGNAQGSGGGVFNGEGGIFNMSGGKIIKNKAIVADSNSFDNSGNGGGVCIHKSNFTMTGGIIGGDGNGKANIAAKRGGGVFHNGIFFKMSGSAKITPSTDGDEHTHGKNDVYLSNNKTIKITETLDAGQNQAARITVPNSKYDVSTQVLTGNTSANASKFKVTKKGSQSWYVGNNGKLTTTPPSP